MIAGFIRAVLLFVIGIPVTIAGVFMVPLALACIPVQYDLAGFTWRMVSLPSWAQLWDNPVDGALGDRRGWWNNYCLEHYGKPASSFYAMFQWLAIRNPANYWSRITAGVDASRLVVVRRAGGNCWQLLLGTRDDGKIYPLFEGKIKYPFSEKSFYWRIGWKIEMGEVISPDTPMADRYRGSVFKFSPWKS